MQFREEAILKTWIDLCTEARVRASEAGDWAAVQIFKLIINACYGKPTYFIHIVLYTLKNMLMFLFRKVLGESVEQNEHVVATRGPGSQGQG